MSRRAVALAALFAGLLLIPATASAGPPHYIVDPGYTTHVELRGTNGYRINLYAGDRHWVTITVRKGGIVTRYETRGVRQGKFGAVARFPGFGRVSFQFKANGRRHRYSQPPWCEGADGLVLEGRILGRVRFAGEERYTSVDVGRAKAEVETWPRLRCRYLEPDGRRQRRKWTATFGAFAETLPSIEFTADRYARRLRPASKQVAFNVFTGAREHGIWIFRSARVVADNSTFAVPDPKRAPENVILRPPPPFSGTGTFQRTPESVFTWEGDLSIQFPGIDPLPLTGERFAIDYCAQLGCVQREGDD
jgi:hypothetical protein